MNTQEAFKACSRYENLGTPDEIKIKLDRIPRLQQENEQLQELVRLAAEDMDKHCYTCKYLDKKRNGCGRYSPITEIDTIRRCCNETKEGWQWQHADKLKELGVEV